MIPGLENAKFLRYGQIHRNTYINAPRVLTRTLNLREHPRNFLCGADFGGRGVYGVDCDGDAGGDVCGGDRRSAAWLEPVPRGTALGSLVRYITEADAKRFQPANITFDLLEPLDEETRRKVRDKRERHRMQCERALAVDGGLAEGGTPPPPRGCGKSLILRVRWVLRVGYYPPGASVARRKKLARGRKTIPQRLKPDSFCCGYGTAEGRAPSKKAFFHKLQGRARHRVVSGSTAVWIFKERRRKSPTAGGRAWISCLL